MVARELASWIETANVDNLPATVTRAAPAGGIAHYVTSIAGGFSAASVGLKLVLKQGAAEIGRWNVDNSTVLAFSSPIRIEAGKAVSLELDASGTVGVVGSVTLTGYTV
jgi:hypothetical protein